MTGTSLVPAACSRHIHTLQRADGVLLHIRRLARPLEQLCSPRLALDFVLVVLARQASRFP